MTAFRAFAGVAMRLCGPLEVAVVLCLGSALAGGLAQVLDWHYRKRDGIVQRWADVRIIKFPQGQGASAMTTGLATVVPVLRPSTLVTSPLLPSMPLPIWVFGLVWFSYDWYELGTLMEAGSLINHVNHLGGMAFCAVYAGRRLVSLPNVRLPAILTTLCV